MTGFQKLLCLSLERTPATDLIDGTVMAWQEAVTDGRTWEQGRDAARIAQAFVTMGRTRRTWPAPADFLDALPRVEQAAIAYEVKPASPEQAKAALAKIRAMLATTGEAMPSHRPPPTRRDAPTIDRAAAVAELAKHYGKSAACGPDA